jgi:hypothetical protein
MSEASPAPASSRPPAVGVPRPVITQAANGAIVRWDPPTAEALADAFPGLKVRALCGVGGMGAVYRAEQARLGRKVAVKILPAVATADRESRERFEREARVLSGLDHPHVLNLHDFGVLPDGTLYLVTAWAGGGDLAKLMDGKAHPAAQVRSWVRQIAEALKIAHARGVIHRDLKPANVLVLDDGRLALADFGLAHVTNPGMGAALTTAGTIFGTFEYMAPEQMQSAGQVTPSADLYSLAVITYQMLTGRVPRGAYLKPSRLARLPAEVDAFMELALSNDVKRRPADADDFVRRFGRACDAPLLRRRRQWIGLGVVLIVGTLAWARLEIIRAEREAASAEARAAAVSEALTAARAGLAAARAAAREAAASSATEHSDAGQTEPAGPH